MVVFCQFMVSGCRSTPGASSRPPAVERQNAGLKEADLQRRAKAHALYATAVVYEVEQNTDAALKAYNEAVRLDPGNEDLLFDVSRRYLLYKKPEKVVEILEGPASTGTASSQLLTQLGYAYFQTGAKEKALASYNQAINAKPPFFPAYQQLVLYYLATKQPSEAIGILDSGASDDNPSADFLIGLGELYLTVAVQAPDLKEEGWKKALAVLGRAEKLQPTELPLRLALADHLSALGETQRAAQLYLDVLKALPAGAEIRERLHAKLTELYLRSNDTERANEQLEAIVKSDPTNPQAYYFLGVIAMEQKQPEKAIEPFQKTVLLKPDFQQAYFDLANAQISVDKAKDALDTLAKVRQAFQPSFLLEYLSAVALTREKEYKEALVHYTAAEVMAQAAEPKRLNPYFYFQFGAASERQSDFAQAEALFEKALALDPDFHEAKNYLGYMWAERGTNLARAHELIEQALKAEPDNDAYLDSMGWVLFRLERSKEALPFLLKAAERAEKPDATVYDHLGDVYSALGESEKAGDAWRKSLSIEESDQVRKKLEPGSAR